jgi:cytochrome P450
MAARDIDPAKPESIYEAVTAAKELEVGAEDFPEREFETFRLLREHMPVSCPERMRGSGFMGQAPSQLWFMARYDDVAYVFRHPEQFSSDMGFRWIPQGVDPPEHTEYRRILNPWFSQEELDKLEPRIQQFASELIDKMLTKDEFDFVEEFSEPFPTIIFCEMMGFPLEDYPKFMAWKDVFIHATTQGKKNGLPPGIRDENGRLKQDKLQELLVQTGTELYGYFGRLIEERRREPKDDMTTKLVQARYGDERLLTDDEILKTLHLLMLGGLDTVTSTLGFIMLYLAKHPEKRREFVAHMEDPQWVGPAIEELVRYTAIVSPARRVTSDLSYRGVQMKEGDLVMISTPSANRDEAAFPDPDEVIFDRHPNAHLGFAVGPHRCLGMHLARRELKVALQEVHRRMPDYAIKPGARPEVYGGGVKGVTSLPLVRAKA